MSTRTLGNLRNGRNDITSLQILFRGGHLTTLGSAGRCFSGEVLGRLLGMWSCFLSTEMLIHIWIVRWNVNTWFIHERIVASEKKRRKKQLLAYLKSVAILVAESGSPSRKGHTRWPVLTGITRSIAEYWAKESNSSNTDFSKTHPRGFSPVIAKTMTVKWHVVIQLARIQIFIKLRHETGIIPNSAC